MFSIIVTLISIALVACLAIASMYYGGNLFAQSAVNARTTQLLAEASQIQGAVELFKAENGRNPSGPVELATGGVYHKAFPDNWGGGPSYLSTNPTADSVSQDSCVMFNQKRLGISTIPSCTDPLYTEKVVCCEEPPVFPTP